MTLHPHRTPKLWVPEQSCLIRLASEYSRGRTGSFFCVYAPRPAPPPAL